MHGRKIGGDPEDRIVSALEGAETTLGGIERALDGIIGALRRPPWARLRIDPASEIMIERIKEGFEERRQVYAEGRRSKRFEDLSIPEVRLMHEHIGALLEVLEPLCGRKETGSGR